MTRPYTLSVGGRETKQLFEERTGRSAFVRGRQATLRKNLELELAIALAESLVPKPKGRGKR